MAKLWRIVQMPKTCADAEDGAALCSRVVKRTGFGAMIGGHARAAVWRCGDAAVVMVLRGRV
jgi:hypothetical protein